MIVDRGVEEGSVGFVGPVGPVGVEVSVTVGRPLNPASPGVDTAVAPPADVADATRLMPFPPEAEEGGTPTLTGGALPGLPNAPEPGKVFPNSQKNALLTVSDVLEEDGALICSVFRK